MAIKPGKRPVLDKNAPVGELFDQVEETKASTSGKVLHPFRVLKRQFADVKVRYRGLVKNTSQIKMMFARSILWMVRT